MMDFKEKVNGALNKIPKPKNNSDSTIQKSNASGEFFSRGISEMMKDRTVVIGLVALVLVFIIVIVLIAAVPAPGIRDLLSGEASPAAVQQQENGESTPQGGQVATTEQPSSYELKPGDEEKIEYLAMAFAKSEDYSQDVIVEDVDIVSKLNDTSRSAIFYTTYNTPPEWADSPISRKSGSVSASNDEVNKRMTDLFGSGTPELSTDGFDYVIEKNGDLWELNPADGGIYYESRLGPVSVNGNEITAECLVVGFDNWNGLARSSRWILTLVPEEDNFFSFRVTGMKKGSSQGDIEIKDSSTNIPNDNEFNLTRRAYDGLPYMVWYAIPDDNGEVSLTLDFGSKKTVLGIAISFGNYYEHGGTGRSGYEFEVIDDQGNDLGSVYLTYEDFLEDEYFGLVFDESVDTSSLTLKLVDTDLVFGSMDEFEGPFAPIADIMIL